ncbi:hypothetical protein BHE74_00021807, partial [Ensete ventricosum]
GTCNQQAQSLAEHLRVELDETNDRRALAEYGYQLALARLQTRYPGVEIELDPFVSFSEDDDVPMADEQPFDDSLPPLEE